MAITSLGLTLPPNINSPYFYDIVGNVSTSRFRPSSPARNLGLPSARRASEFSSLELKPRYPLMGGWNYTFTVGYNAPLQTYLKTRGSGNFVLAVPFLTAIKDVAIDDVTLNVRLPEGAKYAPDLPSPLRN
jgi:oligosaccharyltransferase complex subunit alpha (ribophorin I)